MSGIGIIIKGANFASKGLGKVSRKTIVELKSISIAANDSYVGESANLSVIYNPSNTSSTGVYWSIESGSEYASINPFGLLTIKSNANDSSIVVKAVSKFNPSISATKRISVTYDETPVYATSLTVEVGEQVNNEIQATVSYFPSDTTKFGVTWSIEGSAATINATTGLIRVINYGNILVKATYNENPSVFATKFLNVSKESEQFPDVLQSVWDMNDIDSKITSFYGDSAGMLKESYANAYRLLGDIPNLYPAGWEGSNKVVIFSDEEKATAHLRVGATGPTHAYDADTNLVLNTKDSTYNGFSVVGSTTTSHTLGKNFSKMLIITKEPIEQPDGWTASNADIVQKYKLGSSSEIVLEDNQLDILWAMNSLTDGVHLSASALGKEKFSFTTLYIEVDNTKTDASYVKSIKVDGVEYVSQLEAGALHYYKATGSEGFKCYNNSITLFA